MPTRMKLGISLALLSLTGLAHGENVYKPLVFDPQFFSTQPLGTFAKAVPEYVPPQFDEGKIVRTQNVHTKIPDSFKHEIPPRPPIKSAVTMSTFNLRNFYVNAELWGTTGSADVDLMVDSGSYDIRITENIFKKIGGEKVGWANYNVANGIQTQNDYFILKSVKVGAIVMKNVRASIGPGPMLLGQTFLQGLKSWSIDNANAKLTMEMED